MNTQRESKLQQKNCTGVFLVKKKLKKKYYYQKSTPGFSFFAEGNSI